MRLLRNFLIGLGLLVVALGLLVGLSPLLVESEQFREKIEARGSKAFDRPFLIGGGIRLQPSLNPRVVLEDIRVGNPAWATEPYLLTAQRLELQVDLLALALGDLVVMDVVFDGVKLLLERRGDGADNFTFERGGRTVVISDLEQVEMRDAVFVYRGEGTAPIEVEIMEARSQAIGGTPGHASGRGRFRGVEFDFDILAERPYVGGQDLVPWQLAIRSRSPAFNLDVNARVADPATWAAVVYRLSASGKATEPLRKLVGADLPELGEYTVSGTIALEETGYRLSALSGRMQRGEGVPEIRVLSGDGRVVHGEGLNLKLAAQLGESPLALTLEPVSAEDVGDTRPFRLALRSGDSVLMAAGRFHEDPGGPALTADVTAKGPDLGLWGPWLGRALPAQAYSARARLSRGRKGYVVQGLKATVGELSLAGDLRYETAGPRPRLSGRLTIPDVDLTRLLGSGGPASLDAPINTDWLTAMDAELELAAGALSVSEISLRDLTLSADLEAGRLRLGSMKATLAGSRLSGSAELQAVAEGLALQAHAGGRRLDVPKLLQELEAGPALEGALEKPALAVSAKGRTWRELLTQTTIKLSSTPSKLRHRRAEPSSARLIELDSLTVKAERGGPLTAEARGRVEGQPLVFNLQGHTLLGLAGGAGRWPVKFELRSPNARLQARGSVAEPWAVRGFDLEHRLTGERFEQLTPAISLIVPLHGPFEISGRFKDREGQYLLSELHARIGQSQFSGGITWDPREGRPHVAAKLDSPELHITDFTIGLLEDDEDEKAATQVQAADTRAERLIPDYTIPVETLRAIDLDLHLRVERVLSPTVTLGGFTSDVKLQDGVLTLSEAMVKGSGGANLSTRLHLDARSDPPYTEWTVKARDLDYGRLLEHLEVTDLVEGKIDLDLHLAGPGATQQSFLGQVDGHLVLVGGRGRLASRKLDLWAGDLTRVMLSPRWERKESAEIECVVARVDVVDGLAKTQGLLLDTKRVTIAGSGTLDLASEEIDLVVKPAPKQASLVSLASPARVSGTLAEPRFSRTKLPTDRKLSAASGLLAGLINPAFLALSLSHLGSGEKNPCAAAMEAARAEANQSSPSPVRERAGEVGTTSHPSGRSQAPISPAR